MKELLERLEKVEMLARRASTPGERAAAEAAAERIRARLATMQPKPPPKAKNPEYEPPRTNSDGSTRYRVDGISYQVHHKAGRPPGSPCTMRVRYHVQADPGDEDTVDEYVAFGHKGFPRRKAEIWWYHYAPNIACPRSTQEAVQHGMRGNLRCPRYIHVVEDGPWNRIIHFEFV